MLLRSLVSTCDNAATRFPAPLLPSLQHTPKPEAIVAVAHAARHEVSISYTRLLVATLACVPICLAHTAAASATHGADTRPQCLQMGLATPCRIYRAQRFLSSDAAKASRYSSCTSVLTITGTVRTELRSGASPGSHRPQTHQFQVCRNNGKW